MMKFWMTENGRMTEVAQAIPGCWIDLTMPTGQEINEIERTLKIEPSFLRAALDEEESPRIDKEDEQTLIIIDAPTVEEEGQSYSTFPMGIVVTEQNIITVSMHENPILKEVAAGQVKNVQTMHKTRFVFTVLLRIATRYLAYLRQIDKLSAQMEKKLYKSQRNQELIHLLSLEKSLVYFSTSLKSNEVTLEKLLRGRAIKLYEEDAELLEDVLIEIKQAIDMANIYSSILSGMMDAFASVISNNLNVIMKILTSITILITVPNIIFSYYGMNMGDMPLANPWFPIALSAGIVILIGLLLKKKDLF